MFARFLTSISGYLSFTFIAFNGKEGKGVEPGIEVARGYVTTFEGNWGDIMREGTLMAMPKCLKDCWEKYRTLKKSGKKNGNLQKLSHLFSFLTDWVSEDFERNLKKFSH